MKQPLLKPKKSKGFALIFVLVFVALVLAIVIDMMYQSQITVRSTLSQQQEIQAESAAHSGVEVAKTLLTLYLASAQYQDNPYIQIPKHMYSSLNGIPLGKEGFEQITALTGRSLNSLIDESVLTAIETSVPGYFVLNISSENKKLNINLLQSTYTTQTQQALLRIFSAPETHDILEANGYSPQDLVNNLTSYIKISATDGLNLEAITQSAYNAIGAKYKPKHGALESLEELRRIPGFNLDLIYDLFQPYLTIWPISAPPNSLNINIAPTDFLATLMTPTGSAIDQLAWDKFDDYRQNGTFNSNNIGSWFKENLASFANDTSAESFRQTFLGTQDSIFRVESRGVFQGVERTLVMIFLASPSSGSSGGSGSGSSSGSGSGSASGSGSGSGSGSSSQNNSSLTLLHQEWVAH